MHILLLADLHFRTDWYRWAHAQKADLVANAGDLLNGFHPDGLLPQMLAIKKWAVLCPFPLALSSGNHDGNIEGGGRGGEIDPEINRAAALELLAHENWMDALARPTVVTDRRSQILETEKGKLVITTIPFFPGRKGPRLCDELWEEGGRLRKESGAPWLVLHHEPPADTAVGGHSGDPALFYKIQEQEPDFVLSGHIHGQPYRGRFADLLGRTWCFNPGVPVISRSIKTKIPNHIWLDLERKSATWHATPNVGKNPIAEEIALTR